MDRVINIKVGGNYISKDNKNAGVTGEGNVTNLRITFDEGWKYYAKTVTFWDAHGGNPVKRVETVDLIEDIAADTLTYITPIPPEPLAIAGEMTFVIDGYLDGKRQRSISDKLVVKESPMTDNAGEPTDPTAEPYEQLQSEIEKIKQDIQDTAKAKEEIENMSISCETLSPGENAFVEKTGEEGINLHFGLPAGEKGEQGPKGMQGYTPSVVLRYDETTGNLYYDSDGILVGKEYIETQNLVTKDDLTIQMGSIEPVLDDIIALQETFLIPDGNGVAY